jgi:hypothetical protein
VCRRARTAAGLTTYRYLFAGNFSNITPRYWLGAMHSSELPLVFGTHFEFNGNSTELEYETSYAMEGGPLPLLLYHTYRSIANSSTIRFLGLLPDELVRIADGQPRPHMAQVHGQRVADGSVWE